MSLFMRELDSIARCAAQYRAEQLAPLGLKSCHASYLLEICSCPGNLSRAAGPKNLF